jgi:predicted deacylase
MEEIAKITKLDLESLEKGKTHHFWFKLLNTKNTTLKQVIIPLKIMRGSKKGPVLGLTAAVHGDELNGMEVIHTLFKKIKPQELKGTILAIPVTNFEAFINRKRKFTGGVDLNHIMPGKINGTEHEKYAYNLVKKLISKMDYLIDLHTARFGHANMLYTKSDMSNKISAKMAKQFNTKVIQNHKPTPTTLRGSAQKLKIPAITVEIGEPLKYQRIIIERCAQGILNFLSEQKMIKEIKYEKFKGVICNDTYRVLAQKSGLQDIIPKIGEKIKKDAIIAIRYDVFGDKMEIIRAKTDGILIGKSIIPLNVKGTKIMHIGVEPKQSLINSSNTTTKNEK